MSRLIYRLGSDLLVLACLMAVGLSVLSVEDRGVSVGLRSASIHAPAAQPFGYACQQETPEQALNDFSVLRDRVPQEEQTALFRAIDLILRARLTQYLFSGDTRLSHQRKATGMFPFHSFW